MKKILIVNDGFPPHSWGGANTIAYLHAKALQAEGFDVRVFTTTEVREREGESVYEGIPVSTFYTHYHYRWWAYKSLNNREVTGVFEKRLKDFTPDVVHFHNIHHYFSYRSIAIAKKSGAKVFLTAHDVMSFSYQKLHHFIDYSSTTIPTSFSYHVPWRVNMRDAKRRYNPLRNFFIRRYLRQVDQIFAVSKALKQALADNGISGNVSVVHNGIDSKEFMGGADTHALKEKLHIGEAKTILFVGRFTPDKGRDVAIGALAEAIKTTPSATLVVVGFDPKQRPEPVMEKLIDRLGVRDRIIFVGSVPHSDISTYYRSVDCVLVPSIVFDSFPTANLEAMAARKPVVATCFGGSSEAVLDQRTGYIVNPLDTKTMGERLAALLSNEERAASFGEAGYKRVQEEFSLKKQLRGYEAFY